jgi:hypothetical protein
MELNILSQKILGGKGKNTSKKMKIIESGKKNK